MSHGATDDARWNFRMRISWNGFFVDGERPVQVAFRHPTDVDGFAGRAGPPGRADPPCDPGCDGRIVFRSDRYMHDDEGIDLFRLEHGLNGPGMLVFRRKADHIDGIPQRRRGREKGCKSRLRYLG